MTKTYIFPDGKKAVFEYDHDGIGKVTIEAMDMLMGLITDGRKRGEWIDMGDFEQCSACKGTHLKEFQTYYGKATWIKTDFCPNCGADMREVRDE